MPVSGFDKTFQFPVQRLDRQSHYIGKGAFYAPDRHIADPLMNAVGSRFVIRALGLQVVVDLFVTECV